MSYSPEVPPNLSLIDRVVVITGAARGMGRAHVETCIEAGARVVLTDVLDDLGADLCRSLPDGRAVYVHADVSTEGDWDRVVDVAQARFGRVDGLVNNAGILLERSLRETSVDEFNRVVAVNQTGVFLGMRAIAPLMEAAGGGSIVNISSVAGMVGFREAFAYTASKFAVRGMSKAAALELASHNIRVNAVFPGDTLTPMIEGSGSDAVADTGSIPLRRYGVPSEIAAVVRFLLSDAASYMTGAELTVDGGYVAQ
ncbi:glucose 1-dehydrogenase [Nocardioides pocheonensis]|jgi:3alpha(or 20beta)-hydroxysteroid dehydrogenase|uniref:Glucose 1-dehydrogenase n=1 Tax=Nocardioides pocheonensis TaxID=661485 RepID=A0A3N0GH73_9ACTN|nr:glucose 1-dehydrogenase [Nocardioides pocheonensis]